MTDVLKLFLAVTAILTPLSSAFCAQKEIIVDGKVIAKVHTVKEGETLAKISKMYYNEGKLYPLIAELNGILNPDMLTEGTELYIPPTPEIILSDIGQSGAGGIVPEVSTAAVGALSTEEIAIRDGKFKWRKENNDVLFAGEYLKFAIRWKFVLVGYATMEIRNIENIDGRPAFHIYSEAKSAPFFDVFFKVRDSNESWIDVESLCSLKFRSDISEGGYKKTETIVFNQRDQSFLIVESSKTGIIPLWVQDVLSAFYYLRTKDITPGNDYFVDAHSGDLSWPLKARVLSSDTTSVPAGKFKCIVVEPLLREDSGIFQARGRLKVWMTNDKKKMPVKMSSKIAVGSIDALLVEYR